MATLRVIWISPSLLKCSESCTAQNIFLCVTPSKLADRTYCTDFAAGRVPFPWTSIEATLLSVIEVQATCYHPVCYQYDIEYESSLLIGGAVLEAGDISGIYCEGCQAKSLLEHIGNEITVERILKPGKPFEELRLTSQHGCQYEFADLQLSVD